MKALLLLVLIFLSAHAHADTETSFNAFPPPLTNLRDLAVTPQGEVLALRQAMSPFSQLWVFSADGALLSRHLEGKKSVVEIAPSEVDKPGKIVVDDAGRAYVTNITAQKQWRISVLSLKTFQPESHIDNIGGEPLNPYICLALSPKNNLVIFDKPREGGTRLLITRGGREILHKRMLLEIDASDCTVLSDGNIIAIDRKKKRIVELDETGNHIAQLPIALQDPVAVTAGPDNTFYIADDGTAEILQVREQSVIKRWGSRGHGNAQFASLRAIAFARGKLYIADAGIIKEFDQGGKWVRQFNGARAPGKIISPKGLALGANDSVYVADAGLGFIQHFDADGHWLQSIGREELQTPTVVLTHENIILVVDIARQKLFVFNIGGSIQKKIDLPSDINPMQIGSLHIGREQNSALLLERISNDETARIWKVNLDTGEFSQLPSITAEKRRAVAITRSGKVYLEDPTGKGVDIHDIERGSSLRWNERTIEKREPVSFAAAVAEGPDETIYIADRSGTVARLRAVNANGQRIWTQWGDVRPESFGDITSMLAMRDGSLLISDNSWGTVLRLREDEQGRLVPVEPGTARTPTQQPGPEHVAHKEVAETIPAPESTITNDTEESPTSFGDIALLGGLVLGGLALLAGAWRMSRKK